LLLLLLHVQVRSFENTVHRITVTKRPGMENVPLLVDSGKEGTYEAQQHEVRARGGGDASCVRACVWW
jgi:predicted transcriptional regulator